MAPHVLRSVRGFLLRNRTRLQIAFVLALLLAEHVLIVLWMPLQDSGWIVARAMALLTVPALVVLTFGLLFEKSRRKWVAFTLVAFVAPLIWPWPIALGVQIYEKDLLSYLSSDDPSPRQIGFFHFERADRRRGCLVTREETSGYAGLWFHESPGGLMASRLSPVWVLATED